MSNNSIVVIGDIIESKKIDNRKSVQNKLAKLLAKLNDDYQEYIESPFKITLGDEFYGVINNFFPLIDILQLLKVEFKEIDFRFGIGQGEFNDQKQGTAYENALKAVKFVKNKNFRDLNQARNLVVVLNSDVVIAVKGGYGTLSA